MKRKRMKRMKGKCVAEIIKTSIVIALVLVAVHAPVAEAQRERPKAVIVVVNRLSPGDLVGNESLHNIHRLLREGCVGLMNTVTRGRKGDVSGYVSIGAGARTAGSVGPARLTLSRGEDLYGAPAADAYRAYMGDPGKTPSRPGLPSTATCHGYRVFNLGFVSWLKENASLGYEVTLGRMATTLREAGLLWALIGNSDVPPDRFRPSMGIAMDDTGRVPLGETGGRLNREDPTFPGGVRTDWDAMKKVFLDVESEASLIVVECGDTNRIEAARSYLHENREASLRQAALRDVDTFLGWLDSRLNPEKDLLILLSPSPPRKASDLGDTFTPIIVKGGVFRGGFLSSPTTKTPGLISNVDVAPTVLEHLGSLAPLPGLAETNSGASLSMFGRPAQPVSDTSDGFRVVPRGGSKVMPEDGSMAISDRAALASPNSSDLLQYLFSMHGESLSNHMFRPAIIKGFVAAYVVILGLTVLIVELNRRVPCFLVISLSSLPLFPVFLPLVRRAATFFADIVGPSTVFYLTNEGPSAETRFLASWSLAVILAAGISLALSAVFLRIAKTEPHAAVALPASFIVVILLLDQFGRSGLTVDTPFGHSLIGGARYYGMGNEYMGLSVGAAIIAASCCTFFVKNDFLGQFLLLGLLLVNAIAIALPSFGANFGGGIAATAGLVSTGWFLRKPTRWPDGKRSRNVFRILAAIGVAAVCLTCVSLALENSASEGALTHLGFAVSRVRALGIGEVADIYIRKMQMNLKLIRYSVWTKALLASMVTFGIMLYRPYGVFKNLQASFPHLMAGVKGAGAAAFVALVSNDSGVVAAAMSLMSASSAFLYTVVWTHNRRAEVID